MADGSAKSKPQGIPRLKNPRFGAIMVVSLVIHEHNAYKEMNKSSSKPAELGVGGGHCANGDDGKANF